jgi:hypothetical protein
MDVLGSVWAGAGRRQPKRQHADRPDQMLAWMWVRAEGASDVIAGHTDSYYWCSHWPLQLGQYWCSQLPLRLVQSDCIHSSHQGLGFGVTQSLWSCFGPVKKLFPSSMPPVSKLPALCLQLNVSESGSLSPRLCIGP